MVELPVEFSKIWEDFLALSGTRQSGFGIGPITYTEIASYSKLMGYTLEPWEVQVIKVFDRVTMEEISKRQPKK